MWRAGTAAPRSPVPQWEDTNRKPMCRARGSPYETVSPYSNETAGGTFMTVPSGSSRFLTLCVLMAVTKR